MTAAPVSSADRFSVFWLRDNCGCGECRDPRNGQKLFQITDLPPSLAIGSEQTVTLGGRAVQEIRWLPDGHLSCYPHDWLADHAEDHPLSGDGTSRNGARPVVRPGRHRTRTAARGRQALPLRDRAGLPRDRLSAASVYTLGVQRGPMTAGEVADFGAGPYAGDAVRLRRWDEAAKSPDLTTPEFGHYRPMLAGLVR